MRLPSKKFEEWLETLPNGKLARSVKNLAKKAFNAGYLLGFAAGKRYMLKKMED